jgi:hypothetical protein
MGLLSTMTQDLLYRIEHINYPCGCNSYLEGERHLIPFSRHRLPKIMKFIDTILSQVTNQIHYAIERFMSSNYRKSNPDTILDLVISMEVRLGKGESGDSIKYKICNRIMNCLSSDPIKSYQNILD